MMTRQWSVLGEGPQAAARQMAMIFALGVVLAAAGLLSAPAQERMLLTGILAVSLVLTAVTWWLPWQRFGALSPLVLCLPVLVILGVSAWYSSGSAAGTAPFLMLLVVWVGLHFPAGAVLALGPLMALVYLPPRFAAGEEARTLISAALFVFVLVGVGVVIARQVDHQRRDRDTIHRMERWRAALTATLAHDVRSPLTSAQFAVETLAEGGDDLVDEQRQEIAAMALRQINRIRRLATGLLDAERLESHGGLRLDLRPVELRAAVDEAVGYLSAPVIVDVPAGLHVRADPERLEQILINLATNAIRHGAPPIVISAEPVGPMIGIHVRDHGSGVPESKRSLLFSRFSSADTAPESVGLGLWITRELTHAHGGEVSYSPADPGSRFTVTLPAAGPAAPPAAG
ncbi:HAMP domain-containing histidine kinase [Planomonospora sp. ID67723]|uniref:sensor histidine kinase n=1 Tax=Planomonospora sp. ID67723 TaxID=2738134 RepID=UPI0018C3A4B5|nr:HAMP domain-containing sensor histidine kinase [Planomonospora sp. ID67723]MBG0826997.1 HAMP domain-containing histidine kinase [Planomonospora sp. ID67723]